MFYSPVWEYGEFKLVIRPDTPNYHVYWTPRGSRARRVSTRTSDLEEAKKFLVRHADRVGSPLKHAPSDLPLLDVVCDYVDRHREAGKDLWPYTKTLKHLTEFQEKVRAVFVADFTLEVQRQYVEWRRARLLSQGHKATNGTLNRELGIFKAAMRSAWKRGKLESVPHVELLPSPPPRDRFLRTHEVRRLLEVCRMPHLRLFVMLALHTLQRPGAIYKLRVEQVNLMWNRIDFLPPGATQSAKRRPVVPITPSLKPFLEEAIANSVSGHVLEYKGLPIKNVRRAFASACRDADLQDVSQYVLRHTGATLMAASGVPLRQIAGMLGHTETRTTELYAKHHPDYLSDAARALETLFGSTGNKPNSTILIPHAHGLDERNGSILCLQTQSKLEDGDARRSLGACGTTAVTQKPRAVEHFGSTCTDTD